MSRRPIVLTSVAAIALSIGCSNGAGTGGGGGSSTGATSASNSASSVSGTGAATSTASSGTGGNTSVPPPTCVDVATLPAWRQGMAIGAWKHLASADLTAIKPAVDPGGGYYGRIDAWNGFGADTVNSVVYLGAAGGHADYAGNEVYTLDLTAASPQWVLRIQPSPSATYVVDAPYYTDGRPSPTHTYWTAWFIEQRQRYFRFAGAATWGTGNGGTKHIDSWNPATNDWDPAGTNPDFGPSPTYEMPTAKNMLTGDVYQLEGDNHVYAWTSATNTVNDLGNAELGTDSHYDLYGSPSVVDTKNARLIFLRDEANMGAARILSLAGGWSTAPIGGPDGAAMLADAEQGMAWFDSCADRVFFKSTTAGDLYEIDATTLAVTRLPTSGDAPPDPLNGVHTLFQYIPKLGGYAYQPTHASGMYFVATQ